MPASTRMKTTAIVPWYGGNRLLAKAVGHELRGCKWVGVAFAGGMSELAHIDARSLLVNDLHRHVINLARVMAHPVRGPKLYRLTRRHLFDVDNLRIAQRYCRGCHFDVDLVSEEDAIAWGFSYFIASWQGRHESAGTDAGQSIRWNANGGDSAKHYQSAIASLNAWRRVLRRANFLCLDWRKFLAKCNDEPENGNGNESGGVPFAFQSRVADNGRGAPSDTMYALTESIGKGGQTDRRPQVVDAQAMVRRLMPVECLRLQGMPDDWLDGLDLSDSAKYRMTGNAVALPVVEWIGKRIVEAASK